MTRPVLLDTITTLAEPLVAAQGLEIWGIELLQSGRPVVRLFVDAPALGVKATPPDGLTDTEAQAGLTSATVEQCATISRLLGLALDVEDVLVTSYVLEVSSPGLSRSFFHPGQLPPYIGDTVEMSLYHAPDGFAGRKKFRGILHAVQGEQDPRITIMVSAGEGGESAPLTVPWEDIRRISRVHIFPVKEKPGKKKRTASA